MAKGNKALKWGMAIWGALVGAALVAGSFFKKTNEKNAAWAEGEQWHDCWVSNGGGSDAATDCFHKYTDPQTPQNSLDLGGGGLQEMFRSAWHAITHPVSSLADLGHSFSAAMGEICNPDGLVARTLASVLTHAAPALGLG